MMWTLTGDNSFVLGQELDKLVDSFVREHGDLALERLDGEEAEPASLQAALNAAPFLAARKLVVLKAPGHSKRFLETYEQILADVPESTDVILVEPKLDKRLAYYKFLKQHTDFREFSGVEPAQLTAWLVKTAEQRKGHLSTADARYLIDRVGSDQLLLNNELEKLLLYEPDVSRRTIDLLTEPNPESTIFQLLENAFAGRAKRTLELYEEQRSQRVDPAQIIAMLAWQLRVLAIIKTAGDRSPEQIAKEAGLNPYVVRKSLGLAAKLELPALRRLITKLLQIDYRSKRQSLDIDEALREYLLKLTRT